MCKVPPRAPPGAAAGIGSRSGSSLGIDQQIPHAPHCINFGCRARTLELTPQVMHMDGHCVGGKFIVDSIELLFENRLGYDAAQAPHEVLEDGAFPARQKQRTVVDADVALDRVERDIAGVKDCSESTARTPQERVDPRNELSDCERLDEVVIG